MRNDLDIRHDEILDWIRETRSKEYMCKQLKCQRATLDSWLNRNDIEYAGNQGNRGQASSAYVPLDEYMLKHTQYPAKIKAKLLREGVKEYRCEICSLEEWLSQPIPLCIDHIDGNRYNNKLINLRIICHNCHAQTDTFAGRSKGKKLS